MNDDTVVDGATKDLLNSDCVNVELVRVSGHGVEGSLSNESAQEVLNTELLGSNGGLDAVLELSAVANVLHAVA